MSQTAQDDLFPQLVSDLELARTVMLWAVNRAEKGEQILFRQRLERIERTIKQAKETCQ